MIVVTLRSHKFWAFYTQCIRTLHSFVRIHKIPFHFSVYNTRRLGIETGNEAIYVQHTCALSKLCHIQYSRLHQFSVESIVDRLVAVVWW